MTEQEFASKVVKDKAFMLEVFKHIPEEVVEAQAKKGEEQGGSAENMGPAFAEVLMPAAQAMGYDFDATVLGDAMKNAVETLSGFGKIKFIARFATTMKKAGKGGK